MEKPILTDPRMRQLACASCGTNLQCGAKADSCWCQAYPSLPLAAVRPALDCLCERCLLSAHIDFELAQKTMPLGALGQIGELAQQIARVQKTLRPRVDRCAIIVFAGDHGVSEEAVSAYPKEVTWQMVENFRAGGAAINVLARAHGIALTVVDAGVDHDFSDSCPGQTGADAQAGSDFLVRKIARGTANFVKGPAMTLAQAQNCIDSGRAVAADVMARTGCQAIGFGEMGIANTTSAAALICHLLHLLPEKVVGRGTGLGDAGLEHKRLVVRRALSLHAAARTPVEVLSAFGGFEIGQMVGAMLEAFKAGQILVIDGFISCAALLVARAIEPELLPSCVFAHQSGELGSGLVLQTLNVVPLLDLGLRLGEGSGAALAMPLLRSAASIMREMASFASAGVSQERA
jgi:nicotinate-nucleotide--dimethylbenzimidazole phosphoribosyltransferase